MTGSHYHGRFSQLPSEAYVDNEARINVKNTVNRLAGSRFIEEKQYKA